MKELMIYTSFNMYRSSKICVPLLMALLLCAAGSFDAQAQQDQAVVDSVMNMMGDQQGSSEEVRVPFGTMEKQRLTGSVTQIDAEQILRYDHSQDVLNALQGRVPGLMGNRNIRGMGAALVVVNGIPRPAGRLNLNEVERISVLRGITASVLYGTQADNGVILIETKQGRPAQFTRRVSTEYGVGDPISLPKYLGSAQYMRLYNEALQNDGEEVLYDQETIELHETSNNSLRYPDQHYLNDQYLRDYQPFSNVYADFRGGNQTARYYLNMGYERSGTLVDLGEEKNAKFQEFKLRGRVDTKINDIMEPFLETRILFDKSHGAPGNFWNAVASSSTRPHLYKARIDASELPSDLREAAKLIDGQYVAGGTPQFQNNQYALLTQGGFTDGTERFLQFDSGINFDLDRYVQGLRVHTKISLDLSNTWSEQIVNQFAIYQPTVIPGGTGSDSLAFNKIGRWSPATTPSAGGTNFERRFGLYGVVDYTPQLNEGHDLDVTGLVYMDRYEFGSLQTPEAHHFGLRANYMFQGKYVAEVAGAYSGSARLPSNTKWGLSPSVGAGWIMSEEGFMGNSPVFDFLKLHASWGILKSDRNMGYRLYESTFGRTGNYSFGDQTINNNGTEINTISNNFLEYEKHRQIEVGVDAELLDHRLALHGSVFHKKYYDQVTRPLSQFPAYLANNVAFDNYGTDEYQGIEVGLDYRDEFGDWNLGMGINFVYATSEVIKISEPRFEDAYLSRVGKPTDAIYGYVAEGLFQDSTEIAQHAQQQFGEVRPGDIKYKDLNGDGVINQNDRRHIGNNRDRMQYGVALNIGYKNFNLFIIGTGRSGQETMFNSDYYWVDGNDKYSEVVLDRWTPDNRDASYPRLTSQSSSNNFRTSTFWLEKLNAFSIDRLQLSYNVDFNKRNALSTGIQVYVRASNLFTISPFRDKLNLRVGAVPQMRNYSAGIKISFNE